MAFFEKQARLLEVANEGEQPEYETLGGRADGEGVLFEQLTAGLAFLRCVRLRLTFLLSSNDTAGGTKFDDLILTWQDEHKGQQEGATGFNGAPTTLPSETGNQDRPSLQALFVQQKYKTSPKRKTILFDHVTKKSEDFCIRNFHDSYLKIRDSLNGGNYALVVYTNSTLGEEVEHMFIPEDSESSPWMKLLESGGCVYKLNPDNEDVKRALEKGDDQFIQNFYLFCGQSNNESMKDKICSELKLILAADESSSKTMCEDLCSSVAEWMKKHKFYLRNDWKSWLNIVDTYIKKEVTACNSIVTRIKYSNVEAVQAYIEGRNPAWIRPPGQEATALTATKLHQIIRDEKHIVVTVTRLSELQEKILCCWGRFCPWLVLVDGTEKSCDNLHPMVKLAGYGRSLIIVSHKGDDSFLDTIKSDDICDDTWKEFKDVKIQLNSEQYSCCLGDLCDTKALKAMADEKPEALVALSQLAGPVRMGQDLDPLPDNHIHRELISKMRVREEFFSTLGEADVCIMDEVSYNLLISVRVPRNVVKFEELDNQLCASNALWPVFGITNNIDLPVIQMMCSKNWNIHVYVLIYQDNGWEILFLHKDSAKIRPYIEEQSRSLWQIVDSLSGRLIVDGKPGIGKSTFLLDIASQVKGKNPSWWILRIDLLTYSEVFKYCASGDEAVKHILLRVVYNKTNVGILEHSLLQHCLKEYAHIICLVDGFDEICPDYAEKCLQVLQQLAPRRGKMLVTTRPSETGRLEAAMGVLAHSLPAFSEEEVRLFHRGCNSKLGATAVVVELLKIPLFSRMHAEALECGTVVDDIVSIYEIFFERKFRRLYEEKWCHDLSIPGNTRMFDREREKQENHLGFLAVSHLLPKLEVPCAAQTSTTDRDELVSAGVIYQFIEDKPVFIHRTFAEHFLAKWCFSDIAKGHCAKVYRAALSDNSLEFFVESFDRMASRGRPLLTAVLNGSGSELESLLQEGADPAERDEVGRNSLHLAAAYGRDSTLLWLLVERLEVAGAEKVGGSASGPAGLWEAVATDAVTAALAAEDDLLRWTPLRYAVERRHWVAVRALLEAGALLRHLGDFQRGLHDPEELWRIFKENGPNALFDHVLGKINSECSQTVQQNVEDLRSLEIQVGVTVACAEMSPDQFLEIATETRRHRKEVAKLLEYKLAEMCTGSPELDLNQDTRLKSRHEAALGSSIWQKLMRRILKWNTTADGGATPRDADGWTELHRAAATSDAEAVRRLIEAGADVSIQNNEGQSAIHLAANVANVDCIKLLLSAGAAVNMKDNLGATPLHRAAQLGRRQNVRLLLAAGADALAQNSVGVTPLHWAAITGNAECVRLLARAVRNLELKDAHGCTALHYAAQSGDLASVKHLLAAGADTGAVNDYLQTPLHLAAWKGEPECVRLLLRAEADVAAKTQWGMTALLYAAQTGNPDCVKSLLRAGADVHEKDAKDDTPLHWAAVSGSAACIRLLLQEGADVHQRDKWGRTPLHWAAQAGSAECVRLLLDAGADALAQDAACETPLQAAAEGKHEACLMILNCAVSD